MWIHNKQDLFVLLGYDVVFSCELVPSIQGFEDCTREGDFWILEKSFNLDRPERLGQNQIDTSKGDQKHFGQLFHILYLRVEFHPYLLT